MDHDEFNEFNDLNNFSNFNNEGKKFIDIYNNLRKIQGMRNI